MQEGLLSLYCCNFNFQSKISQPVRFRRDVPAGPIAFVEEGDGMSTLERVVVTGLGTVTSAGNNVAALWHALLNGTSNISHIDHFDVSSYPTRIASIVRNLNPTEYIPHKRVQRMSRFSQLALIAAQEAVADAKLDYTMEDLDRCGVLLGCSIGGIDDIEETVRLTSENNGKYVSPFFVVKVSPNMAAFAISKWYGLSGYNNTISTGCASGTQAIGDAMYVIRHGRADVMVAGGVDTLVVESMLAGFCSMKALSTRNDDPQKASRPFEKQRDGFVLGEGAGILVLESLSHARARGARIYGEILGYGATADAYHLIAPKPSATTVAHAMKLAIADAQLDPEAIDYVNTHGTGTVLGDIAETKAIKQALGRHAYDIALNSTKSIIGHLVGAAGAVEAVVSLKSLETGWLHPTINLDKADPECDLDYIPHTARQKKIHIAMSNSIGLGGQNAVIIIGNVT